MIALTKSLRIACFLPGSGCIEFLFKANQYQVIKEISDESFQIHFKSLLWKVGRQLLVQGVMDRPFLHLEIRTPFGSSVEDSQVVNALQEITGPNNKAMNLAAWHSLYVEDTNLGSNHRIFASLKEDEFSGIEGGDQSFALELPVLALCETLGLERNSSAFQFLFFHQNVLYSVLYNQNAIAHLLRLNLEKLPNDSLQMRDRLLAHSRFVAAGQEKLGETIPCICLMGQEKSIQSVLPELSLTVHQSQRLIFEPAKKPNELTPNLTGDSKLSALYVQWGLALCSQDPEFLNHNLSNTAKRLELRDWRHSFSLLKTSCLVAFLCLLLFGLQWAFNLYHEKQLQTLNSAAMEHGPQVQRLADIRNQIAKSESRLLELKPLWSNPVAWTDVLSYLDRALPEEAGIENFQSQINSQGRYESSFKVWIKKWDEVDTLRSKLEKSPLFEQVSLSDQRRDIRNGTVDFTVQCIMGVK